MVLYTIGHSTRAFDELVALLRAHGVRQLVDVRTVPRSRRNPQFNKESLGPALRRRRINYRHMKGLGGLRHARKDSALNAGWRNASFRGYADYMQTADFDAALKGLIAIARRRTTAIMCAEAVPWRCHRSMIADALLARRIAVRDIMGPGKARPRKLNPMALVRRGHITYPVEVTRSRPSASRRRRSRKSFV